MLPGRAWLVPQTLACSVRFTAILPGCSAAPSTPGRDTLPWRNFQGGSNVEGARRFRAPRSSGSLPTGNMQPASWNRVLGANAYVQGVRGRSGRATTEAESWEDTLEALEGLITKRHRERLQTDSIEVMQDCLEVPALSPTLPVFGLTILVSPGFLVTMVTELFSERYRTPNMST